MSGITGVHGSMRRTLATVVVLSIAYFIQTITVVLTFITRDTLFIRTYGSPPGASLIALDLPSPLGQHVLPAIIALVAVTTLPCVELYKRGPVHAMSFIFMSCIPNSR